MRNTGCPLIGYFKIWKCWGANISAFTTCLESRLQFRMCRSETIHAQKSVYLLQVEKSEAGMFILFVFRAVPGNELYNVCKYSKAKACSLHRLQRIHDTLCMNSFLSFEWNQRRALQDYTIQYYIIYEYYTCGTHSRFVVLPRTTWCIHRARAYCPDEMMVNSSALVPPAARTDVGAVRRSSLFALRSPARAVFAEKEKKYIFRIHNTIMQYAYNIGASRVMLPL